VRELQLQHAAKHKANLSLTSVLLPVESQISRTDSYSVKIRVRGHARHAPLPITTDNPDNKLNSVLFIILYSSPATTVFHQVLHTMDNDFDDDNDDDGGALFYRIDTWVSRREVFAKSGRATTQVSFSNDGL